MAIVINILIQQTKLEIYVFITRSIIAFYVLV